MDASVKLGRIWNIPIGLHTSWFLIFGLVTWSLAAGYFPGEYPQIPAWGHWLLGLITSLLFFGSVLAHELGHARVALRERLPVNGITLFIFGGVAQIGKEPPSAGAEFRIAIAGPVVSVLLAVVFGGLWLVDQAVPFLAAPSQYLARINALLALFNLIPGFPLDGGRVLRSVVWKVTGNFERATRIASYTGQVVAFGFIAFGVYTLLQGNFFNGLWLAFIGWFLQNAAASAYSQTTMQANLKNVRVAQAMETDCISVPGLVPLDRLVEERILSGGQRCFMVSEDGHLAGMLTLRDITAIPQNKWRFTTTRQAMIPFTRLEKVTPQTDLLEALRMMDSANVAQLPVVEGDELVGVLSREGVVHYLRTRMELGV